MYKRIIALTITLFLTVSVVSCGRETGLPSSESSSNEYYISFGQQNSKQDDSGDSSLLDSELSSGSESSESTSVCVSEQSSISNSAGGNSMISNISQVSDNNRIEAQDAKVAYFGRTYYDERFDASFFNWTNSGFIVSFVGTVISAEFYTDQDLNDKYKPHIKVFVDDESPVEMVIDRNGSFVLAQGLSNEKHTLKVIKINESMLNKLSIKSIETSSGGRFENTDALPERRIEFIGDSITCGFGNIPPYDLLELTSSIEDGTQTYGYFISEHFNTDSRYISVSGAPVYRNYLGNVGDFFKRYSWNDYNDDLSYDFTSWTPDLVVINLGTNDVGAGSTYDEFIANGKKWVNYIRSNYPDAFILWTYGVMNQQNISRIEEIVAYFNTQGDGKVFFHELTPMDTISDGLGGGGHPTYKTHRKMADELIPVIKDITGW